MRNHAYLIIGASSLLLAGGGIFLSQEKEFPDVLLVGASEERSEESFAPQFFDVGEEGAYWSSRIEEDGTEKAYEEFKEAYEKEDFATQHVAAHMFGDLLYSQEGQEALAVCDDMFAFGCYHVFVARSVAEQGVGAVEKLDRICLTKFGLRAGDCQHGIGHGLVEYFGASPEQLLRALEACEDTTDLSLLSGCTWGVFMEYNIRIRTDFDSAAIEVREFDPSRPYDPCPTVPEEFQKTCYAQLAMWWNEALEEDYERIGNLCAGIPSAGNRTVCFFGTGLIGATLGEYDVEAILGKCAKMPTSEGRLICSSGAHESFRSFPGQEEVAPLLCADFAREEHRRCVQDIPSFVLGESRK